MVTCWVYVLRSLLHSTFGHPCKFGSPKESLVLIHVFYPIRSTRRRPEWSKQPWWAWNRRRRECEWRDEDLFSRPLLHPFRPSLSPKPPLSHQQFSSSSFVVSTSSSPSSSSSSSQPRHRQRQRQYHLPKHAKAQTQVETQTQAQGKCEEEANKGDWFTRRNIAHQLPDVRLRASLRTNLFRASHPW